MDERYYILDKEHKIVPVEDVVQWSKWFEKAERRIRVSRHPMFVVSTIFLGINHSFIPGNPPLFFETAIKEGEFWDVVKRHSTHMEAVHYHLEATLELEKKYGGEADYTAPILFPEVAKEETNDISPLDIYD